MIVSLDLTQEFAKMRDLGLPTMFINHHDDMEEEVRWRVSLSELRR